MKLKKAIQTINTFQKSKIKKSDTPNTEHFSKIQKEFNFSIPEELKNYILYYAPKTKIFFRAIGDDIQLYDLANLKYFQNGYNYNPVSKSEIKGWPNENFIIANEGGDPIIFNLKACNAKIQKLTHGYGSWECGEVIADSIGQFLSCTWALHYALTAFEKAPIIDDENGFCLAPKAANWYFKNIEKWAGEYFNIYCYAFDNYKN